MLLQSSGRSVLVLPMRLTFVLTEWCVSCADTILDCVLLYTFK